MQIAWSKSEFSCNILMPKYIHASWSITRHMNTQMTMDEYDILLNMKRTSLFIKHCDILDINNVCMNK